MLQNAENLIHQLYLSLGVDLDYVPVQKYEAFLMAMQFAAATVFFLWFLKFFFSLMKGMLKGGL